MSLCNDVNYIFNDLKSKFPETSSYIDEECQKLNKKYQQKTQKRPSTRQTKEEIKRIILSSINQSRSIFYGDIEKDLHEGNTSEIVESIKHLERAIGNYNKQIIYFSSLQGEFYRKCSKNDLDSINLHSRSHKYFLMKLSKLTEQYNKLLYSELSLSFFMKNMKIIKDICENSAYEFL